MGKVSEFLKNMCEAKSGSMKGKSDDRESWLEQLRQQEMLDVLGGESVRCVGGSCDSQCTPRKTDAKYSDKKCKSSQEIFSRREKGKIWEVSKEIEGCWCNEGKEDKCFEEPCKCDSCEDNVDYEARCYGADAPDYSKEGQKVEENKVVLTTELVSTQPDSPDATEE